MSTEMKPINHSSYQSEDRLSTLKQMVDRKLQAVKASKAQRLLEKPNAGRKG